MTEANIVTSLENLSTEATEVKKVYLPEGTTDLSLTKLSELISIKSSINFIVGKSIFITKMLTEMDKTIDREEGGLFGNDNKYEETFKSIVFQQMGRDLASNRRTRFGFADQIYRQMEHLVK